MKRFQDGIHQWLGGLGFLGGYQAGRTEGSKAILNMLTGRVAKDVLNCNDKVCRMG